MTTNAITSKPILTCVIKHQREFDETGHIEDNSSFEAEENSDELVTQPIRKENQIGRNDPCICGSEKNSKNAVDRGIGTNKLGEKSLWILARLFSTDTEYARLRKKAGKAWGRFLCFGSTRTVPMLPPNNLSILGEFL